MNWYAFSSRLNESNERPRSVTVIGWFLVVAAVLSVLVGVPLALAPPEPIRAFWPQIYNDASPLALSAFFVAASALTLWCGWGLLAAKAVARSVTVGYCVVASVVGFVLYPIEPIYVFNGLTNVGFTLVVWYFLYRPVVSDYFESTAET